MTGSRTAQGRVTARAAKATVSKQTLDFERSLVLNRYFLAQLGAVEFDDLRSRLESAREGDFGDGNSFFFHALVSVGLKDAATRAKLADYDRRILAEERELARGRGVFRFKYFQWLALLFTEMYLDALTDQPAALRRKLNEFVLKEKACGAMPGTMTEFNEDDLRRVAFFMATGSGKTLLLHSHIRQLGHYLAHGAHPEMLAKRADGRREWDNILLITPNEGLSGQHLRELRESGVECGRLVEERGAGGGRGLFGPKVMVVEIHKLADEASGDGVSIGLAELGGSNLVFVDEGHKGLGSDAQTWKNRQKALSAGGFLVEYSATFAQAVGAANGGKRETLMSDYGKTILFDYSYRYFHGDGHGKDFEVLNLSAGTEERAQELLVGGLLVFYQQLRLFRSHGREFRPYEIARPLWVMLGSSVSRRQSGKADNSTGAKTERADVAKVVTFLRRFLEDPKWATGIIAAVLDGSSGFQDEETKADLFFERLEHLRAAKAKELYAEITEQVFHGAGGLELWHLSGESGEIAPAKLAVKDQPVAYRVRTTSEELFKELEALMKKGMSELQRTALGRSLPRLHIENHLYSPILLDPKAPLHGVVDVKVSPPGLHENERLLILELVAHWKKERNNGPCKGVEVFLLRNQAKTGVGFFKRSGFYPDFLLWLRHKPSGWVHLRFLESHGMHHGGLETDGPKIDCLRELENISARRTFATTKFSMDGFILTKTPLGDIRGAQGKTWEELGRDYNVLEQTEKNVAPLLVMPPVARKG